MRIDDVWLCTNIKLNIKIAWPLFPFLDSGVEYCLFMFGQPLPVQSVGGHGTQVLIDELFLLLGNVCYDMWIKFGRSNGADATDGVVLLLESDIIQYLRDIGCRSRAKYLGVRSRRKVDWPHVRGRDYYNMWCRGCVTDIDKIDSCCWTLVLSNSIKSQILIFNEVKSHPSTVHRMSHTPLELRARHISFAKTQ